MCAGRSGLGLALRQQSSGWDCGAPREDTALPLRSLGDSPRPSRKGLGFRLGFPVCAGHPRTLPLDQRCPADLPAGWGCSLLARTVAQLQVAAEHWNYGCATGTGFFIFN